MGILQSLANLFKKYYTKQDVTSTLDLPQNKMSKGLLQDREIRNRITTIRSCRELYARDARVAEPIQMYASDLMGTGFTVTVTDAVLSENKEKAQQIIDDMIKRLNLNSELNIPLIDCFVNGDVFLEVSYNSEGDIVALSSKAQLYMYRHTNDNDVPYDPAKMFFYSDNYYGDTPKDSEVVWFPLWQMIHLRNNHLKKSRYGTPTFAAAIDAAEKLGRAEQNVSMNRLFYAQKTLVHHLTGYSLQEIQEYQSLNQMSIENPYEAVAQYFVTGGAGAGVEVLNTGGGIGALDDVELHVRAMLAASPAPTVLFDYLPGGGSLSDSGLPFKLTQYYMRVRAGRRWVIDSLITPLIEKQLLAKNLWPPHLTLEIKFNDEEMVNAIILQGLLGAKDTVTQ